MKFKQTRSAIHAALTLLRYRLSRRRFRRDERQVIHLDYQGSAVSIKRCEHGIPTITSAAEAGVYFGQGYAAATDRLWQMDLLRRSADGRLSELFGSSKVPFDMYHRTLQFRRIARETVRRIDAQHEQLLNAFTAGVNLRIQQSRTSSLVLPFEFKLLGCKPEAWSPEDSVLILKLMSLRLSMNVKYKALMHELLNVFPPEKVSALGAVCGVGEFVTLSNAGTTVSTPEPCLSAAPGGPDLLPLLRMLGHANATGSNAVVVSGCRTANGYPILANDPHLPFSLPATFHQYHLVCQDPANTFEVTGVNVPGLPGVISGHNQHVAWGITNSQVDIQDLVLCDTRRTQPRFCLFEAESHEEEIRVRGTQSRRICVELTALGPKLNHLCGGVDGLPDVVLCWSGLAPGADMQGLFQLAKARSWMDFKAALRHIESLALNFVFASRDGDIGFKTVGRVPVRQAGLCHTPTRDPWLGFVEFDNLPELLNPPGGIIVNANNPITDNDFSPLLTTLWNPGYRARRMFNWVAAKQGLTMGDLARLQQDALNLHAQDLLPELLSVAGLNASESEVVRVLSAWDFRDDATSQASLLWHRLFDALAKNLYGPEFRRFMPFFEHKNIATTRLLKRAIAGDETPWVKDRLVLAAMVRDAMGTAYRAVEGNNRAWGQHHRLGFKHLLSSALGRLAKFVDIPPRQRHGSGVTVALNAGYPNVTDGAVWSMVTGFSTTHSSSRSLLLPGQSGDFRSRWYADQFHRSSCAAAHLITSRELASGVQETRTPPFADPFKEVFCG